MAYINFKELNEKRKDTLDRLKQETDLVRYAASVGYQIDKTKSCKKWVVMKRGDDKILINGYPNPRTGHWLYQSLSNSQDRGTIVDFMLHRGYKMEDIHKVQYPQIDPEYLKTRKSIQTDFPDPATQTQLANKQFEAFKEFDHNQTYLEQRGISRLTYGGMTNIKTNSYRAIFAQVQDVNDQGIGRICSTVTYGKIEGQEKSSKYNQAGLPRGLIIMYMPRNEEYLKQSGIQGQQWILAESPIDSLSYAQIIDNEAKAQGKHAETKVLIATGGSLGQGIKQELDQVFKLAHRQGKSISLGFDSDEAGQKMVQELLPQIKAIGTQYEVATPANAKDWNQALKQSLQKSQTKGQALSL